VRGGPIRILVVDESDEARALYRELLEGPGREIQVARSADEATRAMRTAASTGAAIDIVLLDVGLRGVDPLVVCGRISAAARTRHAPAVVITGDPDPGLVDAAFASGAADFVSKPLRPGELVPRLVAVARAKRQRERRQVREQRLQDQIGRDKLTGLASRRHLDAALRGELRRAAREGTTIAFVMADIDRFHDFNTCYGHLAGDLCLRRIARVLADGVGRAGDLVARWGGDELCALLPRTDLDGALVVAERMRARIEGLEIAHAPFCAASVTASFGVAALEPREGTPVDALVAPADEALLQAKRRGRNRVQTAPAAHEREVDDDDITTTAAPSRLLHTSDSGSERYG
jgi:diguanylate cyclase (GGDEF)-like protein